MRDAVLFAEYAASKSLPLRNKIVTANLGLARSVAYRYRNSCSIDFEDLQQVASLGLIKAVEKFDSSQGNAFSSFALPWIRGEVLHFIRDKSSPFSKVRKVMEVKRATATAQQSREISQVSRCASLDKVVSCDAHGRPITHIDLICDKREQSLQLCYEARDALDALDGYLKTLPEKQASVLRSFYYDGASSLEIAQKHGCSTGSIWFIRTRALQRLRKIALEDFVS